MTLKFNRVLEIVKVHVRAKISSSSVQQFMSYQQCTGLRSRVSLERIEQLTSAKWRYQLRFFPHSMRTIW